MLKIYLVIGAIPALVGVVIGRYVPAPLIYLPAVSAAAFAAVAAFFLYVLRPPVQETDELGAVFVLRFYLTVSLAFLLGLGGGFLAGWWWS